MNYEDKKIVGIIASNVEPSVALNVIGHLSVAIGKYSDDEIMGKPTITDKSGIDHLGISKFPFIDSTNSSSVLVSSISFG